MCLVGSNLRPVLVRRLPEPAERAGRLDPDPVVVVLGVPPGADPPGAQPEEDRPDQLAEAGGVHRLLLRLLAGKSRKRINLNQFFLTKASNFE